MAPTGPLLGIDLYDTNVCAGGQRVLQVAAYHEVGSTSAIDGDESCSFFVPVACDLAASLVEGQILQYQYAGGGWDEFIFTEMDRPTSGLQKITGRSMLFALQAAGRVYQVDAGGRKRYTFTDSRTVADWITLYVAAHATRRGYPIFAAGTITPPQVVTLAVADMTGAALMRRLAEETGCEWQLRRNGSTNYLLDVVTSINGSAPPVWLREQRNVLSARTSTNRLMQGNRAQPVGAAGWDEHAKGVALARWKVTGIAGAVLTVAAPSGAEFKLVAFGGQYTTASGLTTDWFLVCVRTGRPYRIAASSQSAQTITVAAVGDLVTGDYVEMRESILSYTSRTTAMIYKLSLQPARVSAIGGSVLTMVNEFSGDPVSADDVHNGRRYEVAAFIVANTYDGAVTTTGNINRLTFGTATALIAVGDLVAFNTALAPPYGAIRWGVITTVVSTTVYEVRPYELQIGMENPAAIFAGTIAGPFRLRVYRVRSNVDGWVDDCAAGADTVTVSGSTANIVLDDLLFFYVTHLGDAVSSIPGILLTTYKTAELPAESPDLSGAVNVALAGNPYFDTWTASGSPPDGYTFVGVSPVRFSTGLVGPGAVYNAVLYSTGSTYYNTGLRFLASSTNRYLTLRVRLKTPGVTAWAAAANTYLQAALCLPTGTVLPKGNRYLYPDDGAAVPLVNFSDPVPPDTVAEITITIDLLSQFSAVYIDAILDGVSWLVGGANLGNTMVGGATIWQTATRPAGSVFTKTSDADQLWHFANEQLKRLYLPERTYDVGLLDLGRREPALYADEQIDKGTPVVVDVPSLVGTTPPQLRVVRVEWNHSQPASTRITVGRLPARLTTLLARAGG